MWLSFVFSILLVSDSLGDLVVQLENGKVNGTTISTPSGQTFYAWRGIPYAKPPVGNLRYLPPQKAEPWTYVLDASNDSPACIFFGSFPLDPLPTNGHSEDCLYINVYSPIPIGLNSSVDPVLPVMFWIYGGGFISGTGDFAFTDPTPFLEENVLVVTFNYRLGTFGFLSTGDKVASGNAGLKDQVLALQWTRDNIASFGGNPEKVTIFGESAGAGSVGYHIVSPLSRNLFKGAIMESGSALFGAQSNAMAREAAYVLANQIDSSITNFSKSEQVLDVLQHADADLIVNLTSGGIAVILEIQSNTSFLSEPIYETIEAGNIAKVPTIIGYNSEESIVSLYDLNYTRGIASQYDSDPALLVPTMNLKKNVTKQEVGEKIRQLYLGNKGSFAENLAVYLDMSSDNMLVRSSHKQAILQSKYSPVYIYQFSFYGSLSKNHLIIPGAGRVGHTEEVGYLFNISTRPVETEADYLTRKIFVKLWTNFAKTSNPTPDDDSAELLQNVKWESITEDDLHFLDIDENLQIRPNRKVKEDIFWDNLWGTYSDRPYNSF